jgi:hypothetical protein
VQAHALTNRSPQTASPSDPDRTAAVRSQAELTAGDQDLAQIELRDAVHIH